MNDSVFLQNIGAKLNDAKQDLMASGQRDARGYMETANRIKVAAENLHFSLGNEKFEPVGAMFQAFSERSGMNDVSNVAGVDIVDINILASQNTVMQYLSAERSMDKPTDVAFYQGLEAINAGGGFSAGDTVFNPFTPINYKKLNLGSVVTRGSIAAGASVTATGTITLTGTPLMRKGVALTAIFVAGAVETIIANGYDKDGDGKIYWDNGGVCGKALVNYDTGVITLTDIAANTVITAINATAAVERSGQADGGSTLKLKPKTKTTILEAKANRIILENSFENTAYMNKQMNALQGAGVQMDFGKRAINQMLTVFTQYLDVTSVSATAEVMLSNVPADELDLTTYSLASSDASTKNDYVNSGVLRLNKALQVQSGLGVTCYLVDMEGAIILGNNPMYFTANAAFDQNLNGMIGTYRNIPVIRHMVLDGILDPETGTTRYAFIGALHKSPDGQAAPTMYGEYLSPYSVVPALNYDNPTQFSQALLSMSTTQKLVEQLCVYMAVKIVK